MADNFFDQFDATDTPRLEVRPSGYQPLNLDPRSRELAARTLLGEAANQGDEGMAAVAHVIRNRVQAGRYGGNDVPSVISKPYAFEPWNTPEGRSRMYGYSADSPQFQKAAGIVDQVFGGQLPDNTGGATHFVSPSVQGSLGRNMPKWAQGEPLAQIGSHAFYAPEGPVRTAQTQQPTSQQQPAGNFFDQFDTAKPAVSFQERFPAEPQPNEALQSGLTKSARAMTTGPAQSNMAQIATDFMNQGSAASQRTTPNINAQYGNLISDQAYESDSGEVLYKDPTTGKVVPTDQNKQVALRDPADGRIKIFARTDSTDEGALSAAGRLLGTGMAAGAVTARPAIGAVSKMLPAASDIFSTSKPSYRAFKQTAEKIEIPAQTASDFATRIRGSLEKANLIPELAQPVYSAVGILDKGQPLTLDALQNIKRVVGRSFASPDKNVRDAAAVASNELGKIVSEVSPEAGAALKKADTIHSTALAMQQLQRKGAVADLRTGRAGYGGNAVNSMRNTLSPIVQAADEGKKTLFKPNEIEALREIVVGNPTTNTARLVGQAAPSKGIIGNATTLGTAITAGVTAGAAFAPAALIIPAIGSAANKLATVLTSNQITRMKELVAKRSPAYADAVRKSIERYSKAQEEFAAEPSASKLGAFVSASRTLSSGLTKDGISVSSGDLIRQLQSPAVGRAEGDQQEVPGKPSQ